MQTQTKAPATCFSKLQKCPFLTYFDPSIILFLLTLIYLIPTISFTGANRADPYLPQIIITYIVLFFWLANQFFHYKLGRASEPLKAFFALLGCLLFLLQMYSYKIFKDISNSETDEEEDLLDEHEDLIFGKYFLGVLERTLIFGFSGSRLGIFLNILIIIFRWLSFRPEKLMNILIIAIGDLFLLILVFWYSYSGRPWEAKLKKREAEISFITEKMLPESYTPIFLLKTHNMESVFINNEGKALLTEFSMEVNEFLKILKTKIKSSEKTEENDSPVVGNYIPILDQIQHKRYKMLPQESIEFYGTMDTAIEGKMFYYVKFFKGCYKNEEVICIQLKNITSQEKLKKSEEAVAYKDHVVNTVSHDLRNPISAIIGLLQVCEESIIEPKLKEYLTTCRNIGELLINIVNTYLDGSQIKRKKIKLVPTQINVKKYLEGIAKIYGFLCKQRGLTFSIKMHMKSSYIIVSDRHRLTQILTNLISNAMKFTTEGKITVIASLEHKTGVTEGSHPAITFAVEDTGIGISPEDQEKLFNIFSSLESGAQLNPYGVGIGLMISNELVGLLNKENPQAHIHVKSAVGVGSTFSFSISSSLQRSPDLRSTSRELLNESHVSKESSDDESMISDTGNVIEGKMVDYSKDYGRFNMTKFHHITSRDSPNLHCDSPKSFSILLENSSFDATRQPISITGTVPTLRTQARAVTYNKISTTDLHGLHAGRSLSPLFGKREHHHHHNASRTNRRPSTLGATGRFMSLERVKTPSSRTSRFKPEETHGKPILVVDDNAFNITIMTHMLLEKGFEVKTAINGQRCIQAVKERLHQENFFKLIFMDCDMPVMDGIEATKILKSMMDKGEIPATPIYGVTGAEDEQTIAKCKEVGMAEVVVKPLREEKLYAILKEALEDL